MVYMAAFHRVQAQLFYYYFTNAEVVFQLIAARQASVEEVGEAWTAHHWSSYAYMLLTIHYMKSSSRLSGGELHQL